MQNGFCIALIAVVLSTANFASAAEPAPPATPPASQPAEDRAALEKAFIDTMSGSTLVGFFTVTGSETPPREEKYTIVKVAKAKGDYFLFSAQIQFGQKNVTVPLLLPVKWAGDTPVITVTNVGIPGLGTYTARVMIYDNHYAGTWSGGDHGGHLWGKVEKMKEAAPAKAEEPE